LHMHSKLVWLVFVCIRREDVQGRLFTRIDDDTQAIPVLT